MEIHLKWVIEVYYVHLAQGVAFYDITYSTTEGSVLLEFFPRQDFSDVVRQPDPSSNYDAIQQAWNQCKCNQSNKYVYQMMGEQYSPHANRFNITIYNCNNAHNNEIKLVNKFNEKWNRNDPDHFYILGTIWDEVVKNTRDENGNFLFTTTDWLQYMENKYVIGDCHNLQIDSELQLMFLIDVEITDLGMPLTYTNRKVYFPTLVYDISDRINTITGEKCSVTPKLLRVLEGNIKLKQLTENELNKIVNGTETYDTHGNLELDMPLNDINRPEIFLSGIGSLKREDIGLSETVRFNPTYNCQYNHDLWLFKKNNRNYAVTCYQIRSHSLRDNVVFEQYPKLRFFGNTMGHYCIIDITNIRNDNKQGLPSYQTPIHDGMKHDLKRGPMDAFAHNAAVNANGNLLFTAKEVSSNQSFDADKDYQVQSLVSVYDIRNLENIVFKKYLTNFSWIKSVGPNNTTRNGADWNHNFAIRTFQDREYLAMADFVDGISIFDITEEEAIKLVGKANSTRYIQSKNPYYASDKQGVIFPWCKDGGIVGMTLGAWGVNFGFNGDIYVMTKESVSVYSLWDIGQDDIRDYMNMKTNEKFTKYPSLQVADKITAYDPHDKVLTTLDLVVMNSNLDIAILHSDNLHGGFENHVQNELNKKVYSFNYSQDSILTNDCYIVNSNANTPVSFVQKKYDTGKEKLHNNFGLTHANQDLGVLSDETEVNYAGKVMITLPTFMLSESYGNGCSGSAVVQNNQLVGMLLLNQKFGDVVKSIGVHADHLLPLVDKMLNNQGIPYLGLEVSQNKFKFDGYIIEKFDPETPLYQSIKLIEDGFEKEISFMWELKLMNNIKVGIDETKLTTLYKTLNVNDTVEYEFQLWKKETDKMGSSTYSKIQEIKISSTVLSRKEPQTLNETSTSSGNFYPYIPWFYEELNGSFI